MTMSERRRAIVLALYRRKKETLGNFAFEFGVSKRTIKTDIMCLSVKEPVYTVQGRGGGICIDENYEPNRGPFTMEQADLIARIRPHLDDGEGKAMDYLSEFGAKRNCREGGNV